MDIATQNYKIADLVESLQSETLKMNQAYCPVRHIFGNGIYMRELTIPTGAVIVGHKHRYDHISLLVKGYVTVYNSDGTKTDLKAPLELSSKPGKKCAFAHEETVWVNVHHIDCRDVEELETFLYELDDAPDRIKQIPDNKSLAISDYNSMLDEWGFTEEQVQKEVQCKDQVEFPCGIYKCKVSDSLLHGKGLFATANIKQGEVIAVSNINGHRTPAGRYTNHSHSPNAEMKIIDGNIFLVATKQIAGCFGGNDGEEITTNYRNTLLLLGRKPCQQQLPQP